MSAEIQYSFLKSPIASEMGEGEGDDGGGRQIMFSEYLAARQEYISKHWRSIEHTFDETNSNWILKRRHEKLPPQKNSHICVLHAKICSMNSFPAEQHVLREEAALCHVVYKLYAPPMPPAPHSPSLLLKQSDSLLSWLICTHWDLPARFESCLTGEFLSDSFTTRPLENWGCRVVLKA